MRVVALDPGGTCGWCLWEDDDLKAWGQLSPWAMCDILYYGQLKPDVVVLERFIINGNTHRKTQRGIHQTLDVIGVVRWLASHGRFRLVEQSPNEREPASDDVLNQLGWYKEGLEHTRAAIRHLVMFLTKEKKIVWRRPRS